MRRVPRSGILRPLPWNLRRSRANINQQAPYRQGPRGLLHPMLLEGGHGQILLHTLLLAPQYTQQNEEIVPKKNMYPWSSNKVSCASTEAPVARLQTYFVDQFT
jgi:hypothetical protein